MNSEARLVAVFGHNGCGRTVMAARMAARLSELKKNVALICCDVQAPPVPYLLPAGKDSRHKSLGTLLAIPVLTDKEIAQHSVEVGKNVHLELFGYAEGEHEYCLYQRRQRCGNAGADHDHLLSRI